MILSCFEKKGKDFYDLFEKKGMAFYGVFEKKA